MRLIIIGIFIALMALGTSCAQISQPVAEVAPQGTSDGIKVHGDWTVTVTNPDGTVEAVHEFENALAQSGPQALGVLIAGETHVTDYLLVLNPGTTTPWECEESVYSISSGTWIPARAIRDMTSEGTPVIISGICTVQADEPTEIGTVQTYMDLDSSIEFLRTVTDPATTVSLSRITFTTESGLSIPIANAQMVTFNVVISFE